MCARHTQVVATNLRVYSASLSLTILSLQEVIQPRAKILLFGMEMAHWDIQVYYLKTIILIFFISMRLYSQDYHHLTKTMFDAKSTTNL